MGYPYLLKRIDGVWTYMFPYPSERAFIKMMGRFWLWRRDFKHQAMVGHYRPDFTSRKLMRIIEVDGLSKVPREMHRLREYQQSQAVREAYLLRRGFQVLHVPAYSIKHHPRRTRVEILKWLRSERYEPRFISSR